MSGNHLMDMYGFTTNQFRCEPQRNAMEQALRAQQMAMMSQQSVGMTMKILENEFKREPNPVLLLLGGGS